jgi:hypothetical protein
VLLALAMRKWIPAYTRASLTSLIACAKRVNLRVVPETALWVLKRARFVPKKSRSVRTIEA